MGTQAALTIADSVPANHVFLPTGRLNDGKGTLRWVNRFADNPAASEYVTLLQSQITENAAAVATKGQNVPMRTVGLRMGTFMTYQDTDTGLYMVDYPAWVAVTYGLPVRASELHAFNLITMVRNCMNLTVMKDAITGMAPIYA